MTRLFSQPTSGIGYLFKGLSLSFKSGTRRFILIPLLINLILFGGAFTYVIHHLSQWIDGGLQQLPSWLHWLSYLLWPLLMLGVLVICAYIFSTVANWIAAPFYGLLAESLEAKLLGKPAPDTTWGELIKDIPRIFYREWIKLKYYLPKAIGLLIFMWIPVVGHILGPIFWFVFSAWMMTLQYADYPFDNHKISFDDMRTQLKTQRWTSLGFGSSVMVGMLIPIVNIFVMPAAVCGATLMWVERYRR